MIGRNGTGKTRLVEELLSFYKNVYVLDLKGQIQWPDYRVFNNLENFKNARDHKKIYKPFAKDLRNEQIIDQFFWHIFREGEVVLYVDEVSLVTRGQDVSDGYHAIIAQGRELGITLYQSTQRPKGIPSIVMTESQRFFVFSLNLEADRKRVKEVAPIEEEEIQKLGKFEFLFSDMDAVYGPYKLEINSDEK